MIGADSWELLNFDQLPSNASAARQVEALKADRTWQRLKWEETSRAIDELITDIETNTLKTRPCKRLVTRGGVEIVEGGAK